MSKSMFLYFFSLEFTQWFCLSNKPYLFFFLSSLLCLRISEYVGLQSTSYLTIKADKNSCVLMGNDDSGPWIIFIPITHVF